MSDASHIPDIIIAARQFLASRKIDLAIEQYQLGLEIDPSHKEMHVGIANAYFIAKDYDQAILHFIKITQLNPKDFASFINIGAVYNRKEDYQKAIEFLRKALTRNSAAGEAYYNLGIAYRGLNQLSLAISSYKEAVKLVPKMVEAYQNLGNIYREMGQFDSAIDAYEKALEIRPDFERAQKALILAKQEKQKKKDQDNPFGRLVDQSQIRKRMDRVIYRQLTEHERNIDRYKLRELSADIEKKSQDLIDYTKTVVEPKLTAINRAIVEGKTRESDWVEMHDNYAMILKQFQDLRTDLRRSVLELRGHEEIMNTPVLDTDT
jgi:tetratricopeptide (TPR) repeat protein